MPARYKLNDRRKFQRLELDITVYYKVAEPMDVKVMVGDKEIEATMLDISANGIGLLTGFDIPAYTILSLKFTLEKMNKAGEVSFYGPMEITGEVRYNVLQDKSLHHLGIYFKKIDKDDQCEITNFVKMTVGS